MSLSVILVAAGQGSRMQSQVGNKLLAPIQGRPLLAYTIEAFASCEAIDELILVVADHEIEEMEAQFSRLAPDARFVPGGDTRKQSSERGIQAANSDYVLIHDGARPFPSRDLIHRVIAAMNEHGAAIPVLPIHDALHVSDESFLIPPKGMETPAWVRAQTPQGFRRDQLLACLADSPPSLRDEATALLLHGLPVAVIAGDPLNHKITAPADLSLATAIAWMLEQEP